MNETIKCSINATQDNIFGVQAEFDFDDFQGLSDFPLAEELLPEDKKEIGNPFHLLFLRTD